MTRLPVLLFLLVFLSLNATAAISPGLEEIIESSERNETIDVIVSFEQENSDELIGGLNKSYTVEEEFDIVDAALLELNVSGIENLGEESSVRRIEPDHTMETQVRDSVGKLGASSFWRSGHEGRNVSVAVMDTGIADHDYLEIEDAKDFTGEGPGDLNGHGTHVAGIIGSQHPLYRGVSPEAELYDAKVMTGDGQGKASYMLRGFEWILRNDIDVASISIGSEVENCNGRDIVSRASRQAIRSGTLVVTAAGNQGPDSPSLTAPGCEERLLTVGSVGKNDELASYSSRGPTADSRMKPDVLAPGSSILSTWTENRFRSSSGTSMATPHVSGQAALILSQRDLEPDEVKAVIKDSSDDLGYPKHYQGAGRINVSASYSQEVSERPAGTTGRIRQLLSRLTWFFSW